MPRPTPTPVMHFTHVGHLASIVREGLLSDTLAAQSALLTVEVGNTGIKADRRRRNVPIRPGGVVADYAPFYFAPRSPMMYAIKCGNVPTYSDGCDRLLYLVTSVERLTELGLPILFTDRNAVLKVATFIEGIADLDDLVDWPLMRQRMWYNTPEQPDRRERRMAECLVHDRVPWQAFERIVVHNQACAVEATSALATVGASVPINVVPGWYF